MLKHSFIKPEVSIYSQEDNSTILLKDDVIGNLSINDEKTNSYDTIIKGVIKNLSVDDSTIYYYAASPCDYRSSYSGSGMPFHSKEQAFYSTPNIGTIKLIGNEFTIKLLKPNSYYDKLNEPVINPYVIIYFYCNKVKKETKIEFKDRIPFRDIRFDARHTDVMFYNNQNLEVRTQEQILIDSRYPDKNEMPSNFWSSKPAM